MKDSTKETVNNVGSLVLAGAAVMAGAMLVKGAFKGVAHVAGSIADKRAAKKAAKNVPAPKVEELKNQIPTEVQESTGVKEP